LPGAGRGARGGINWPLEQKPPSQGGAFVTPAPVSPVQAFAIGRERKINETLETVAAWQASFDCGLHDIWRKESERHGHPDRSLGLAFSR
jgi:hypothetical protein